MTATETVSGANLLCPGELPGKREMKQWLDAAIPTLLTGDASLLYCTRERRLALLPGYCYGIRWMYRVPLASV